ncbi:hypothetical protein M408DRAFT_329331 [Serendipita vermifera MAFF 305830]|uniref:Uncharacterized protein n=1 Tax=Serendipita vermifera MAFF 305830 TaxID=933852 RepID=A0A0C3B8S9_SERVB|nr:hypothetical protein M408DRAFT_329331 [Serendipita vermifera MAFF 305830]
MPPTTTTPFPVLLIPRVNLEVSQEPNITARPPAHPGNDQPQPSWQLLVGLVLGAFLFLLILLCYWLSIPCTTSQIVKTMRDEQEMVQKQKQKTRDERFTYERYP